MEERTESREGAQVWTLRGHCRLGKAGRRVSRWQKGHTDTQTQAPGVFRGPASPAPVGARPPVDSAPRPQEPGRALSAGRAHVLRSQSLRLLDSKRTLKGAATAAPSCQRPSPNHPLRMDPSRLLSLSPASWEFSKETARRHGSAAPRARRKEGDSKNNQACGSLFTKPVLKLCTCLSTGSKTSVVLVCFVRVWN